MYLVRSLILRTLDISVRSLSKALLVYIAFFLLATGFTLIEGVEQFPVLAALINTNEIVYAPATRFLESRFPLVFDGFSASPYVLITFLLLLFVCLELYRGRLLDMLYEVSVEWKAHKRKAAERKAAIAWAKEQKQREEAALKREEEYKRRVEAVRRAQELAERQAREEARLLRERELRLRAEREAVDAKRTAEERARAEAEMLAAAEREENARVQAGLLAGAEKEALAHAVEGPLPKGGNAADREQLLEMLAKTKKALDQQKRALSFLAIDVVNSTGMKVGEDPAIAQRDFKHYRRLVEKAIADNKGLKASWTPDGVMICFGSVQNAVQAAQQVISDLRHFNTNVKAMREDFKVRCGINAGQVLFDDSVPMEEMSDRAIDIAGHMQKYAKPNTIYIGKQAIENVRTAAGFQPADTTVDGCEVYQWSAAVSSN